VDPDLHIVVTGLPASGKSTLGRLLHRELALPLLDKDTILESLYDALGSRDRRERSRLSRASDEVLLSLAATARSAILVNWWREDVASRLLRLGVPLIEVFCGCPFEAAAARFEARERHPGHHGRARTPAEVEQAASQLRTTWRGPLGLGSLVRVDTSDGMDARDVVSRVRQAVSTLAVPS
jgi:predicted kinase